MTNRTTLDHPAAPAGERRVAYLLKRYPRLSETFILHEMLALESRGIPLHVFSILDPAEGIVHADVARLAAPVTYLPPPTWSGFTQTARAHLSLLRHAPGRWLWALATAVFVRPPHQRLKHFWRAGWVARAIRDAGIQHVHAHFANAPAALAQFIHRMTGVPFSFTAHAKDIYTTPHDRLQERLREASFAVTCTGFNARYLTDLVDAPTAARLHTIYHGIDLDRFAPGERAPSDPPVILSIGRLVEKKGFADLIAACALLRDRGQSFQCLIVGGGPLKDELRAQIVALGLDDRITLHGSVAQEALMPLYQRATIMALPCVVLENGDRDGIPNVLVEAMQMGVPVVSTAISGIPELITDSENGLLVPPHDVPALAGALTDLLTLPRLRATLAAHGQATVRERFDMARNARRLASAFTGEQLAEPATTTPSRVFAEVAE